VSKSGRIYSNRISTATVMGEVGPETLQLIGKALITLGVASPLLAKDLAAAAGRLKEELLEAMRQREKFETAHELLHVVSSQLDEVGLSFTKAQLRKLERIANP